jgi:hypothetical protein
LLSRCRSLLQAIGACYPEAHVFPIGPDGPGIGRAPGRERFVGRPSTDPQGPLTTFIRRRGGRVARCRITNQDRRVADILALVLRPLSGMRHSGIIVQNPPTVILRRAHAWCYHNGLVINASMHYW